jgi:hypothetical protein
MWKSNYTQRRVSLNVTAFCNGREGKGEGRGKGGEGMCLWSSLFTSNMYPTKISPPTLTSVLQIHPKVSYI